MHDEIHPVKSRRFYTRTLAATGIAATVAAALALLYLSALGLLRALDANLPAAVILVSVGATLAAAPILTLRSVAFGSHLDRLAGLVAECVWTLPFCLGIYSVSYLALSLLVSDPQTSIKMASFSSIVYTLTVTVVTVLAVRLGAIVARAGAKPPKFNLLWTILSAGSLGAVVFTGLLLLKPDNLMSAYYATLVPAIFGIAGAFSSVDKLGTATAPQAALPRRVLALLAILAFGGLLLAPFGKRSDEFGKVLAGQERSVLVKRLPEVLNFSLSAKTKVFIRVSVDNKDPDNKDPDNKNPDGAKKLVVDWVLKDSRQEERISTAYNPAVGGPSPQTYVPFQPNRRTDLYYARDLEPGDYSISIKGFQEASSQKVIFQTVFASLIQRDPLPKIHATLFGSERKPPSSNVRREFLGDRNFDVDSVPFFGYVNVSAKQPVLYVRIDDSLGFEQNFFYYIFTETGGAVFYGGFAKLEPGNYLIVVDQQVLPDPRYPTVAPPPMTERAFKYDVSNQETTTVPRGVTLTAGSVGLTDASIPTVVSGNRPAPVYVAIPMLPAAHPVRVEGDPREVNFQLLSASPAVVLDLFNQAGFLTRTYGSGLIAQELESGLYWLVASRQSEFNEPPRMGPHGAPILPRGTPAKDVVLTIR